MRLDERQFINALGLAGVNATGLMSWVDDPSEDSRPLVIGVAAQNGMRAAILASKGMGGPLRILDDAKYSIYDAFSTAMYLDRVTQALGKRFWILEAGGYKRYPCCADIHSGIDALLSIRATQNIDAGQILKITHRVKPARVNVIDNNILKSHNSQYILSVAAVQGAVAPDDILSDRRSDRAVAELYTRAELLPDESLNAIEGAPGMVELELRTGRSLRQRVDYPKGSRQNPMTPGGIGTEVPGVGDHICRRTTGTEDHQDDRTAGGARRRWTVDVPAGQITRNGADRTVGRVSTRHSATACRRS